ncbi:MAG: F0F1 ATP synthase subunit alpha [bacterium]|nr:F0F1 ATP synthase subunit alpha [bacterium]MDZ4284871.1 F0F1 ATP synthase subunit alpha [Patescibacteria group bacterium]
MSNSTLSQQNSNGGGREVGVVVSSSRYLMELEGLPSVRLNSLLINRAGRRALVTAFSETRVRAVLFDETLAEAGSEFFERDTPLSLPRASELIGRLVSPLGDLLDEKGAVGGERMALVLDPVATGIRGRAEITEQFLTGVALIDLLLPLGRGQRELIIGPIRSGKGSVLRDFISNQRGSGVICMYAAIGKPAAQIRRFRAFLDETGARAYTTIVAARADEPTPLVALVPAAALALAESFSRDGRDVLLILDDIATHAKYLREMALLAGSIPGRESYPGDIFYQHAHLIELAGRFKGERGTITLLPVLESDEESMTTLIPTNAMAATDGHLFFSSSLYARGSYPSIEISRSVTRVGKQTQRAAQKELADRLLALLADFEEREAFSRFGAELVGETRQAISQALVSLELLRQRPGDYRDPVATVLVLALVFTSFFASRGRVFAEKWSEKLFQVASDSPALRAARDIVLTDRPLEALLAELERVKHVFENVCR